MKPEAFCALFVLVSVMTLTVESASAQAASEADVHAFEHLESVWNEAHERGDADALESLWANDLEIAVPHMSVLTRADAAKFAHSGQMKFERYYTSDLHVRVYGDAAVVSGRLQRLRTMNGQQVSDDWRFTKVYVREAGKWRVVAFHASEGAPALAVH